MTILRPTSGTGNSEEIRLNKGSELALVCNGEGDPKPTIKWSREVMKINKINVDLNNFDLFATFSANACQTAATTSRATRSSTGT